jgi:hypothetical protein
MPLVPFDWNVVVVGGWNRAILTPQGIITRLFQMPEGTEFHLEVPMDAIGPYRVVYGGLVVMADPRMLVIEAPVNTFENLAEAMVIGYRAIENLPETPVSAAGFNVRFKGDSQEKDLEPLLQATQHDWDGRLADARYPLCERSISRAVHWEGGKILMSLAQNEEAMITLALNFERRGSRDQMMTWLAVDPQTVRAQVETIVSRVLQLTPESL